MSARCLHNVDGVAKRKDRETKGHWYFSGLDQKRSLVQLQGIFWSNFVPQSSTQRSLIIKFIVFDYKIYCHMIFLFAHCILMFLFFLFQSQWRLHRISASPTWLQLKLPSYGQSQIVVTSTDFSSLMTSSRSRTTSVALRITFQRNTDHLLFTVQCL